MTYKVSYKLYKRSRQIRTEKVSADNRIAAQLAIALKYQKYPFQFVSFFAED